MLEKLPVHLKDAGIIGKNIRKRARYLAVIGRHSFKPWLHICLYKLCGKVHILR